MHKLRGSSSRKSESSGNKWYSKRGKGGNDNEATQRDEETPEVTRFMFAVVTTTEGKADVLQVRRVPRPKPKADEMLVKVSSAGVNRPDIHQRETKLPPWEGSSDGGSNRRSDYLGLECSGTISEYGVGMSEKDMKAWKIGDKVCAITDGGSYAQYVAVPVAQLLPFPSNSTSVKEAATFPQAACTVWSELFMEERLSDALQEYEKKGARLSSGETLLIHGGSSSIGTFAIQMAKHQGVTVFVTAGSDEKLEACRKLGASVCINYRKEAFEKRVLMETEGKGVNVILDCRGEDYFQQNCSCLSSSGGRLVTIGPNCNTFGQDSHKESLGRHIVNACALRNRTPEMKALIVKKVLKHVWPAIRNGSVTASNIKTFTFKQAAEAHALMESGNFIGRILLIPGTLP
ncbi:uncharacterized protein LOC133729896 [Rosa rugosa]|uniref:uncharacterized protein LOC133729896 n=1 Tax=Rosa rugosa TaxID=74645 RepID=UPI002B408B83|nr:uncharacterized protein LOC133729896 [Rosa rugosa]